MQKFLLPSLLLCGTILIAAPAAHAATAGSSTLISLDADPIVDLTVDKSLTISPTAADYAADSIQRLGANGIAVTIKSNSSNGAKLSVHGTAGSTLPSSNISVKESSQSTFIQLTDVDQDIYSSSTAMTYASPTSLRIDVKVSPLSTFSDQPFSNTLVFTATTNAGAPT